MNPRLRAAVIAAPPRTCRRTTSSAPSRRRAAATPRPTTRSATRATGRRGAVIVEVLTDNRNRAAGDVRATFTKHGGNLAETGAVSFMFDHVGVVEYDVKAASATC